MRLVKTLFAGVLSIVPAFVALSQEPIWVPTDPPDTIRGLERRLANPVRSDPGQIADRIRELGGTLRDMTHDCGAAKARRYGQIDLRVRACSWGGRYSALLFEPAGTDAPGSVVVLASTGARLEVLFEDAAPPSLVQALSGLLQDDFEAMFEELSDPNDG